MAQVHIERFAWIDDEPGWRRFRVELWRLARRNWEHPGPLALLALCTTLAGLLYGYRYTPNYEARIALRITEHDLHVAVAPRPIGALKAFVSDVALSDRVLERVLLRFNLYPAQRARGLDQALEALRDEIGVEVWRNEFLAEGVDSVGRSARVALSYRHEEPDVAWGVVEALAEAVVAEQRRVRRAQAEYLALGLEPALQELDQRLDTMKRELLVLAEPAAAGLRADLLRAARRAELTKDIAEMERRRREIGERKREAELRLRAETLNLGLRSDIIDSMRPRRQPVRMPAVLAGSTLGLLAGLLLGGITLKAFDRRIYDEADLRRMGLEVSGALPPYPGDDVGSMRSRVRMTVS